MSTTSPKVGIVSVGATNPYGHPTAAAMTRLHDAGVKTYWTSAGKGAAPVSGQDAVSTGSAIVVEVAPSIEDDLANDATKPSSGSARNRQ